MAKKPEAGIEIGPAREGVTGLKPGQAMVKSPEVRKLQAVALIREMAINGGNLPAAAAKFNMSTSIARARLSYAQRAGLFIQHEDALLTGIVPRAEDVLMRFLSPTMLVDAEGKEVVDSAGNIIVLAPTKDQATIAAQVFKGVGLFRRPGTTAPAVAERGSKKGMTLEEHIANLRQKAAELNDPDNPVPEEAIDVEFSYLGSLRPVLAQLPPTLSRPQRSAAILKALQAQTNSLPRPLSRRLARLTKQLGMATPETPKRYMDTLNRELTKLSADIQRLPQFRTLYPTLE